MPKRSEHPSYPNPTIVETVCEVHFRLSVESPWKLSVPGTFYALISKDYVELEPVRPFSIQFQVSPQGIGQAAVSHSQRARFKHKREPLMIQLGEESLTINALAPYPGWKFLQPKILSTWMKAADLLKPVAISRVGLRYINRIERTAADELPGEWLKPTTYIPAAVLSSAPGFLSRAETHQGERGRIIVTLADEPEQPMQAARAIIFDIDRISEQELSPTTVALKKQTTLLHKDIWDIFCEAQTQRLERLLNQEQN